MAQKRGTLKEIARAASRKTRAKDAVREEARKSASYLGDSISGT